MERSGCVRLCGFQAAEILRGSKVTETRLEAGLAIQREMFGSEFADDALNNASDFKRPFQAMMTEHCFGDVWTRPGLTRRERSLITVAMLAALNRTPEVGLHVRGALSNGATLEEIREVLMQVMIYAGVPSAVGAFRVADEALSGAGK